MDRLSMVGVSTTKVEASNDVSEDLMSLVGRRALKGASNLDPESDLADWLLVQLKSDVNARMKQADSAWFRALLPVLRRTEALYQYVLRCASEESLASCMWLMKNCHFPSTDLRSQYGITRRYEKGLNNAVDCRDLRRIISGIASLELGLGEVAARMYAIPYLEYCGKTAGAIYTLATDEWLTQQQPDRLHVLGLGAGARRIEVLDKPCPVRVRASIERVLHLLQEQGCTLPRLILFAQDVDETSTCFSLSGMGDGTLRVTTRQQEFLISDGVVSQASFNVSSRAVRPLRGRILQAFVRIASVARQAFGGRHWEIDCVQSGPDLHVVPSYASFHKRFEQAPSYLDASALQEVRKVSVDVVVAGASVLGIAKRPCVHVVEDSDASDVPAEEARLVVLGPNRELCWERRQYFRERGVAVVGLRCTSDLLFLKQALEDRRIAWKLCPQRRTLVLEKLRAPAVQAGSVRLTEPVHVTVWHHPADQNVTLLNYRTRRLLRRLRITQDLERASFTELLDLIALKKSRRARAGLGVLVAKLHRLWEQGAGRYDTYGLLTECNALYGAILEQIESELLPQVLDSAPSSTSRLHAIGKLEALLTGPQPGKPGFLTVAAQARILTRRRSHSDAIGSEVLLSFRKGATEAQLPKVDLLEAVVKRLGLQRLLCGVAATKKGELRLTELLESLESDRDVYSWYEEVWQLCERLEYQSSTRLHVEFERIVRLGGRLLAKEKPKPWRAELSLDGLEQVYLAYSWVSLEQLKVGGSQCESWVERAPAVLEAMATAFPTARNSMSRYLRGISSRLSERRPEWSTQQDLNLALGLSLGTELPEIPRSAQTRSRIVRFTLDRALGALRAQYCGDPDLSDRIERYLADADLERVQYAVQPDGDKFYTIPFKRGELLIREGEGVSEFRVARKIESQEEARRLRLHALCLNVEASGKLYFNRRYGHVLVDLGSCEDSIDKLLPILTADEVPDCRNVMARYRGDVTRELAYDAPGLASTIIGQSDMYDLSVLAASLSGTLSVCPNERETIQELSSIISRRIRKSADVNWEDLRPLVLYAPELPEIAKLVRNTADEVERALWAPSGRDLAQMQSIAGSQEDSVLIRVLEAETRRRLKSITAKDVREELEKKLDRLGVELFEAKHSGLLLALSWLSKDAAEGGALCYRLNQENFADEILDQLSAGGMRRYNAMQSLHALSYAYVWLDIPGLDPSLLLDATRHVWSAVVNSIPEFGPVALRRFAVESDNRWFQRFILARN